MANKEQIEQRFEKMLMPIVEENNFELVDVEYVKEAGTWYLRAYIDKEGGFSVNDCEFVSRKVSDLLDKEDFIEDAYILEISSPGLGRALKKEKDFARSIGKEVDVKLYKAINKQKDFTGVLDSYDSEKVTLKFSDDSAMDFLRKDIAQIRLSIDF
ncbi:MAG: ribosome maturation factor RimP [Lachnospiraceae bacterium]|nr:ribosome maturation factor RimP [Lachnospiraceae bacterium]